MLKKRSLTICPTPIFREKQLSWLIAQRCSVANQPIHTSIGITSNWLLRSQFYATITDNGRKEHDSKRHQQAYVTDWPATTNPTPYQIFFQPRQAPYDKARFYALVKLYHPDRQIHTSSPLSLPHAICLERYRLVVAANEILSSPTKRRAYDSTGAGWSFAASPASPTREAYRAWRNTPDNGSNNATWEDWEQWYARRDGRAPRQQPVYISNELFAALLCTFIIVASLVRARRASYNVDKAAEMRDRRHDAISQEMTRQRVEQAGLSRQERVDTFLRQRKGWSVAVETAERQNGEEPH